MDAKTTTDQSPPLAVFRLYETIRALEGLKARGLAFAAGAVAVAALPGLPFLPLIMVASISILVMLMDGAAARQTAWRARMWDMALLAWSWGFGYFLLSLLWIGKPFIIEGNFLWLMPFALILMPTGLALFFAAAGALSSIYWREGWRRVVVLALALSLTEWLRGHLFTGFPWNLLGYTLVEAGNAHIWLLSVFGIYGVTFLALVFYAAVLAPIRFRKAEKQYRWPMFFAVMAVLVFVSRLSDFAVPTAQSLPMQENVTLRVVQPNLDQTSKWDATHRKSIFERYLKLSAKKTKRYPEGLKNVSHVIWPESALPFLVLRAPYALREIAKMMPENTTLITGGNRAQNKMRARGNEKTENLPFDVSRHQRPDIFNSLLIMDHKARLIAKYDKSHLVPFGEYLPFQPVLEAIGLRQLTRLRGGFTSGKGLRTMRVPGTPSFSPLICYEVIFPGRVVGKGGRPQFLLTVTNDAWFGSGQGSDQHFMQARVRAIEEGLPLVRAANSGISAVLGPQGQIVKILGWGQRDVIDAKLPKPLPPTLYARYGDGMFVLLMLLAFFGLFTDHHLQRRKSDKESPVSG